ncbi:WGR domain protein [compost metagenome]
MRQRGHEVQEQVGRSQFRCDLAIVDPVGGDYQLAILLDGPEQKVTDTCERYVFRPGVLRGFGWRVIDVPGRDWLRSPDAVLARIEAALQGADDAVGDEAFEDSESVENKHVLPPPEALTDAVDAATNANEALVRRFVFEQGTSRKFWQASVNGQELVVTYGRIGTTGQRNVKAFDSADRARREMDKLVAEKLGKGYREE